MDTIILEALETLMLLCFAISWPASIYKSLKSRTSKGKSLIFLLFVLIGYLAGISKVIMGAGWTNFLMIPYCFNFILVFIDLMIYFRNDRLDKKTASANP
jgi:hypothetical protein